MRFWIILLFTILLLHVQLVSGQYYETGQDPASLKWKQIKTGRFTVIYPENYDSTGISYARELNKAYSEIISIYPEKKFKIPVIIHSYTVKSNGYVAWAPHRMELYPAPEQNTIPLDQVKLLTIHELTHVFQMESLNKKFSKGMSFVFGEQFPGAMASLLPLWFLEGDAVFAESALTEAGRGRYPSFQKQLKAIAVEHDMYKYDKIFNGSFKDFVPNHYESGFQMVAWSRTKYDPQIWNRVLDYTSREPFTLNPVNISLSKTAGLKKKTLFRETFDTLGTIWKNEVTENRCPVYETINQEKKGKYINYYSPVFAGNDSIIAVKTSLQDPPEFVMINMLDKSEKRIHVPGSMSPYAISYGRGNLVWVEFETDPRWENRSYSVIRVMDINSGKVRKITRKSRYLAASVSPGGRKIAAIENSAGNINRLVIINAVNGEVMQSVNAPENVWLQRPGWSYDGQKITFITLTKTGEGIMSFAPATDKWDTLIEPGNEDLQISFIRNDSLFFISSCSGTDNVYLKTPDNKLMKMTRSRFGANDLCVNSKDVYFVDYSSSGNSICRTTISDADTYIPEAKSSSSFLINRFNPSIPASSLTDSIKYTPEPYRKWQHLFRIHSWMPLYADIEEIREDPATIRPGITIMSQNNLSTLISSIGYEYSADKNHVFHSRVTWQGLYPVFESVFEYGTSPILYKFGTAGGDPSDIQTGKVFSNRILIPLSFSSGRFSEYLQPSITSDYRNDYVYIKESNFHDYGQMILTGRLFFSNYYRYALRDIYSRWAQVIDLSYAYAPFDKTIYGSQVALKTSFYFPGFMPNNTIKIRYDKEKQEPVRLMLKNKASFPRGYYNIISKDLDFLSADYILPLAYPDFNISSLLYLKRIRGGMFYDYASGKGNKYLTATSNGISAGTYHDIRETFRSFGFELLADFHILRIPFMVSAGIQSAWKEHSDAPVIEFLFNIDLFGMSVGKSPM